MLKQTYKSFNIIALVLMGIKYKRSHTHMFKSLIDFFTSSTLTIKERRPVRMVETDQAGFHVSGWKSDIERHNRELVLNLPEGVVI